MIWDYHVIFVWRDPITNNRVVYDLDTTLGFPFDLEDYLNQTFPNGVTEEFAPRFNIIDVEDYVSNFTSDRSHMKLPNGSWQALPPPWECIGSNGSNLLKYIAAANLTKRDLLNQA